jgi:cytoskeletal protein CcmA (bactofilin family)
MARDPSPAATDSIISIVGSGMTIQGDCETEGTIRIEGTIHGSIKAGKAVVIGKSGVVNGDIATQDAVISGRVVGTLVAASRLELQATCHIDGEVHTRRMQLEEGAVLNGSVHMNTDPGQRGTAGAPPPTRSGGPDDRSS